MWCSNEVPDHDATDIAPWSRTGGIHLYKAIYGGVWRGGNTKYGNGLPCKMGFRLAERADQRTRISGIDSERGRSRRSQLYILRYSLPHQ